MQCDVAVLHVAVHAVTSDTIEQRYSVVLQCSAAVQIIAESHCSDALQCCAVDIALVYICTAVVEAVCVGLGVWCGCGWVQLCKGTNSA